MNWESVVWTAVAALALVGVHTIWTVFVRKKPILPQISEEVSPSIPPSSLEEAQARLAKLQQDRKNEGK